MCKGNRSMSRRDVLSTAAAFALASSFGLDSIGRAAPARSGGPNILFIMADDLGYADLSCYGRRDYETPVLDALAQSGVMLTQGYANSPICSPTRAALITGRYQYRLPAGLAEPLSPHQPLGLSPSVPTMPDAFQKLGYDTSLIGKWHLGLLPDHGPLKSGYDRFFGVYEGAADYITHELHIGDRTIGGLFEGEDPVESQGYLTDLLAERAIAEIRASAKARKPFFMSLHFTAPHWPWQSPGDKADPRALSQSVQGESGSLAIYAAMVKNLDWNIGRVLDALGDAGLTENTIVVFTSDNGGERFSDTWPFTGVKTELLEGGIRVPLIVSWPGRIAPGSHSDQVMISMDFLPTLYAAVENAPKLDMDVDGEDLLDVLTGNAPTRPRKLYWRYKANDQQAARDGNWKYLKVGSKEFLFDVVRDQRERANLKRKHPQVFSRLKADYAAWNNEMLAYPAESISHDLREVLPDR